MKPFKKIFKKPLLQGQGKGPEEKRDREGMERKKGRKRINNVNINQ